MTPVYLLITLAYTGLATLAVGLHALNLREAMLNQHAIRALADGIGEEVATMVVRMEAARLMIAALIAGLGYGVIVGFHGIGWILIPIPLISIYASWRDLRSRQRAAEMAAVLLQEKAAFTVASEEPPPLG